MPAPTLVCYFARVGDLLMLTPVLRAIAAQGPVELCARPWAAGLLAHEPWLAGMHHLTKPNWPIWQDRLLGGVRHRLGQRLAARGFSRIVIMDREGPHTRRWIDAWRGATPLVELPLSSQAKGLHLVDANVAAAAAAGIPVSDSAPRLTIPPALADSVRARLQPLGRRVVAVQAGSSLTHRWFRRQPNLKGLAPDQWGRLLDRILADGEADAVVLHGSAPEGREARAIIGAMEPELRARCHDLTGEVSLAELPAVLAASRACISVDTGPAHIAAAVGCPLLTVFGPTDPGRFLPRGAGRVQALIGSAPCRPCLGTKVYRSCRANICLTGLSDEALHTGWLAVRPNA
jgi:heptosyltransferase-2/heptosyltransferase-3